MPEKTRVTDYEVSGRVAEELEAALLSGAAPQIRLAYHVFFQGVCGNHSPKHSLTLFTNVAVGNKSVVKGAARNFVLSGKVRKDATKPTGDGKEESDRAKISVEHLGTIDLLETTLRESLLELFPQFASVFSAVRLVNYSVHGIGAGGDSHLVSASVRFAYSLRRDSDAKLETEKTQSVKCDGVDTIRASIECIVTFYNWILWRMLRREQGLAKAKEEL